MKSKSFSLIEVLLATVILAMGAVFYSKITAKSSNLIIEGEREWARMHLKSLAAEYYLLWGADAPIPSELVPLPYSVTCEELDAPELDGELAQGQWQLKSYLIQLFYEDEKIDEMTINKLLQVESGP